MDIRTNSFDKPKTKNYSETLQDYFENLRENEKKPNVSLELIGLRAILACCERIPSPTKERIFVESVLALEQAQQLVSLRKAA